MFESCEKKQQLLIERFATCQSQAEKYEMIMRIGKEMSPLPDVYKTPEFIVSGCQSIVYLRSFWQEGLIFFQAESEALISNGLAALLTIIYSGETAETILKCPPNYLEVMGIHSALTQNRANGLQSIHLRMKQDALKLYINQATKNI